MIRRRPLVIGRPKKVAAKRTRTPAAPTRAPAQAPPSTPARLLAKKQQQEGSGKIWHTKNEHAIIKSMNAQRLGRGPDGIDQDGVPFEVRESKKTPKFRLQKNVHEELCEREGYYLFKRGETITKMFANNVTCLLKKGAWSRDRVYPYKFLHLRDVVGLIGNGLLDNLKKNDENYYSEYFTLRR